MPNEKTYSELDKRLTIQELNMAKLQEKVDAIHDRVTFWNGAIAVITFVVHTLIHYFVK